MIKKQIEEYRHCRHSKLKEQGLEPIRNVKVWLQVENLESEKFCKLTGKNRSVSKKRTKAQKKGRFSHIEADPFTPKNKGKSFLLPPIVNTENKKSRHSFGPCSYNKAYKDNLGVVVSADRREQKNFTALSTNYGGSETIDVGSNQYSSNRYSLNLEQYLQDSDLNEQNPFQTLPAIKNDSESIQSPYYASKKASTLGQALQSKLFHQVRRRENADNFKRELKRGRNLTVLEIGKLDTTLKREYRAHVLEEHDQNSVYLQQKDEELEKIRDDLCKFQYDVQDTQDCWGDAIKRIDQKAQEGIKFWKSQRISVCSSPEKTRQCTVCDQGLFCEFHKLQHTSLLKEEDFDRFGL